MKTKKRPSPSIDLIFWSSFYDCWDKSDPMLLYCELQRTPSARLFPAELKREGGNLQQKGRGNCSRQRGGKFIIKLQAKKIVTLQYGSLPPRGKTLIHWSIGG